MVVFGGYMVVFSLQRKKNFVGKKSKILKFRIVGVRFSLLNSNSRKLFL